MWQLLEAAGLPSVVLRCPCTFPPDTMRKTAIAANIAINATIVLPLPTSPCTSRFIGAFDCISSKMRSITRCCALVKVNGSSARMRSKVVGEISMTVPFGSFVRSPRLSCRANETQKNSSKIKRRCARLRAAAYSTITTSHHPSA